MVNLKKKVLFGVSVSMVLAMAIGSFALSETQTLASPRAVEAQNSVGATAGAFTVNGGTQGTDYEFTETSGTDGVLKIHPQSIETNITISNTEVTTDRIEVTSAATITLAGVKIDRSSITTNERAALTITDNANFDVKILLADNTTNILKGSAGNDAPVPDISGSPGIQKNGSGDSIGTLTIGVPDGSAGTGKLEATGGESAAGIGSGYEVSASNITINGGIVTATGGRHGAGIGGGDANTASNITASNITISGGEVTATGYLGGTGIGGGDAGSGSNITISSGVVRATSDSGGAGIGGGASRDGSNIKITGGIVTATGGDRGAGIGGGSDGDGSNITITSGVVTANGGWAGTGIGAGYPMYGMSGRTNARNIIISGGEITATGGEYGAAIGSERGGSGSDITIRGGIVTAYGGENGAGIGAGYEGNGSNNSISGDAVVLATSGSTTKLALEGFVDDQQQSLLTKGIVFTGLGTAFDSDGYATDFSWDANGTMYSDSATISQNVEFPANLTIEYGKEITLEAGKTLTISAGATFKNEGIFNIEEGGSITCKYDEVTGTTGEVTTKTDFYREGSTDIYTTGYQTYQTSAGVQNYRDLPNPYQLDPANGKRLINWYYLDQASQKVAISENINVLLNEHSFFENSGYTITVAEFENGSITPDVTEAAKDDTVTLTVTPAEGYQLKEGSLTVTDADGNEVPVTEQDGKYTFTMPDSEIEISATFEGTSHEISVTQPEHGTVTTDPENPKTGDEVIITVTPEEGYEIDGLPIVKTEDGRIIEVIPTGNPNEYKFIMPNSDVTIEVNFVLISEPEVKTGDSFAGIAALAILGLAATGAVMLRKRK